MCASKRRFQKPGSFVARGKVIAMMMLADLMLIWSCDRGSRINMPRPAPSGYPFALSRVQEAIHGGLYADDEPSVVVAMSRLALSQGREFFRCPVSHEEIFVNGDRTRWLEWERDPHAVAVYARFVDSNGHVIYVLSTFDGYFRCVDQLHDYQSTAQSQFISCADAASEIERGRE